MKSFLHIITRTFKRPNLLKNNQEWLEKQTDKDFIQEIITDEVGIGCAKANGNMSSVLPKGKYVYILDDDDYICDTDLISQLKLKVKSEKNPDIIIVNAEIDGVVFPTEFPPKIGTIGNINFIIKESIWEKYCKNYIEDFAADYYFIDHVLKTEKNIKVSFYSRLASKTMRVSKGAAENEPAVLKVSDNVFLKEGKKVKILQGVSGTGINYTQDEIVVITLKNIETIESLLRGGLAEEVNSFPTKEKNKG